ncbi:MAG: LPXTG cell wall anchor domain-containing protein [Oscillospiraceae bacterium]|nr:LPXTG cell wall anchor domain-containing protein [Oscillospiraceae bacterium]
MKKLRKIVSLLLAVVMMMSLCAVQVGATSQATTGSITVKNTSTTESATYKLYKLLDLTWDGADAYSYTVADGWLNFFWDSTLNSGNGGTATNVSNYVSVTYNSADGKYYVTWIGDTSTSVVQAFAQLASDYTTSSTPTVIATDTASANSSVTFNDLALGYYLVSSDAGSLVELTTTNLIATVNDKNTKPILTKEVKTGSTGTYGSVSTADLTDTLYYQITIKGIDEATTLVLHDVLPDGYELDSDVTMTVTLYDCDSKSVVLTDSDYDYSATTCSANPAVTDCSFEIDFAELLAETTSGNYYNYVLNTTTPADAYIVIEYAVKVSTASSVDISTTSTANANVNTAYLYVSGDADDARKATVSTYIYEFYVYKYDSSGTSTPRTPLSGAVFTLSDGTYYATFDSSGYLTGWVSGLVDACYITTGSDGYIHIQGLDVGTYTLTETTAPTGYAMPSPNTTSVVIAETGNGSYVLLADNFSNTYNSTYYAIEVANSTSGAMPTTGGIGTTIFYVVGGVLVIGAVILLITKKRMKDEDK